MTRLRRLTLRQGQLQVIADVFIRTLLHHRASDQTIVNFIEVLFGAQQRHIVFAEAAETFQLDGQDIFPGTRMLVRHDIRTPDLYEIELLSEPDSVSRLTKVGWIQVRGAIRLTDKKAREGAEVVFGGGR